MPVRAVHIVFLLIVLLFAPVAPPCEAAEVIIVADAQLRPVVEIVSGIKKTLRASIKIYSPDEVRGALGRIAEREDAKVVVALGREALGEALHLPPAIPVIYDLVVTPPHVTRPNTTGFFMATPAREYAELISSHLRGIRQIAVVGSRDQLNVLVGNATPQLTSYSVRNSVEFVNTLKHLDSADAILLLPDSSVLTATAIEEAYLLSFRKGIPLLGISERHVKEGALLALVVDMVHVGRLIGEYATKALKGGNIGQLPPSPPRKFELYLNTDTARKMKIAIPEEVVRMVKRAYP